MYERNDEARVLLDGLACVESPRWHEGRLWFAHWGTGEIVAVDMDGHSEVVGWPWRGDFYGLATFTSRWPSAMYMAVALIAILVGAVNFSIGTTVGVQPPPGLGRNLCSA